MTYRIERNGQMFGPYTTAEVHQYIASGNILLTDLAQPEGTEEWVRVDQLFPAAPVQAAVALPHAVAPCVNGPQRLYSDPPDFPWWAALLLGIFTSLAFFVIWDIVEAAWLRKVERSSTALFLYIVVAVLYLLKLPAAIHSVMYNLGFVSSVSSPFSGLLVLLSLAVLLIARFIFRRELLVHFNGPESIGLRLNWFLTLLFGGLYFQYHFNRINEIKRALHVSVPG